MFRKILVANRGEIAVRAFRAATELGVGTVAVFPYEDRHAEYRLKADESYEIGEHGHPVRAYLDVAGIIEARSCERFDLLRRHVQDEELSEFYGGLFESEARHYSTYVRMAKMFRPEAAVKQRLEELMQLEAEILRETDPLPRMHS